MAGTDAKTQAIQAEATKLLSLDYFAALGLTRTATPDDVKKAFLEAVKTWHPDRVPPGLDEAKPLFTKVFARLEQARATLSDADRRARYIVELSKPAGAAATAADMSSAEATLEFRKAEALLKKNDTAQAEQHLRRAVQLAPANVEYQVLLVWLQVKENSPPARLTELASELDRLIERDPKAERAYFYRAQLRKRLDRTKEAMADFERAAELNPKNLDAQREVRLYKMRQERAAPAAAKKSAASGDSEGGAFGFIKKIFKR